jgi:hypothetical protein
MAPTSDFLASPLVPLGAAWCFMGLPVPSRISLPFLATFGNTFLKHMSVPSYNTSRVIGRSRLFSLAAYAVNSDLT